MRPSLRLRLWQPCRLRQCARAGSTALRSRRALSLKTVAINFSLAGPALHLADDNHLTADAVLLHPIRVNTTQRGPHRHEGQADAISPAVGEDARGSQGHDEGLRDGSRLVRVHSGLVRTGDRG